MEASWGRSLRFLTSDLANAAFRADNAGVAEVAAGLSSDERQVENVVLRINPNPEPPHAATADFDLVTLQRGNELDRARWSVSLRFLFLDQVPGDLPWDAICRNIVSGISLVLHMSRIAGRRAIEEARYLTGWESDDNTWLTTPAYLRAAPEAQPVPVR